MRKKQLPFMIKEEFLPRIQQRYSTIDRMQSQVSEKYPYRQPQLRGSKIYNINKLGNIQIFQKQLTQPRLQTQGGSPYYSGQHRIYRKRQSATTKYKQFKQIITQNVRSIKRELQELKTIMESNQSFSDQKAENKLRQITQIIRRQQLKGYSFPQQQQQQQQAMPFIYPIIMPFPYQFSKQGQPQEYDHESQQQSGRNKHKNNSKNKSKNKNKIQQRNRAKSNMKKFKRSIHAIIFFIRLQKFNDRARKFRRPNFDTFIKKKIKGQLSNLRMILLEGIKPFLNLLVAKQNVSFEVQQDEEPKIVKEKVSSTRKLINVLLDGLAKTVKPNCNKFSIVEPIYFQCKHGSYCCQQALLTADEMDLVSVSQTHGYLSAQKNMQKSNIISLVLIKLLLFNVMLSPKTIDDSGRLQDGKVQKNLFLFSSLVYELAMDSQDDYMVDAPKTYKLGNYKLIKNYLIKYVQNIVLDEAEYKEGDLISGLMDEIYLKKYYLIDSWVEERYKVKSLVEALHKGIVLYHKKINSKLY